MPFLFRFDFDASCRRGFNLHAQTAPEEALSLKRQVNQRFVSLLLSFALFLASFGLWSPAVAFAAPTAGDQIRVVGRLPLKLDPSQQREFLSKTKDLARVTRAEDAVISYSCNSDIENSSTFVFEEVWPSEESLQSHLQTDHFKSWWSWVEPHLSGDLVINVASLNSFHELN